ncbi:hypothetical protein BH09PSE3_BH09PSE3_00210 [soil metagenome]
MKFTKVGIIGIGAATANIHLPALRKLRDVQLVGGYDRASSANHRGIATYSSIDELLSTGQPDILLIATPPSSHAELVKHGLRAGCHIFCEKPLANNLEEADDIIATARSVNRHVVVNSEFPSMTVHAEAKKGMTHGGFGKLLFVEMRQSFVVTDATEHGWRGLDQQRTFKEFGTHVIDLAKFFFGEQPTYIRARMPKPDASDGPDYLNIIELGFSGDRVAHIILNRLARGQHRYLDITLNGEHSTIETSIGGRLQFTSGLRTSTRRPFVELDVAMGGRSRRYDGDRFVTLGKSPLDLFAQGTAQVFREFIDAINRGTHPPQSIEDARNTLELLYSAYDCAKDGSVRRFD